MNLEISRTSGINFQGKKEILYGITKAADAVHSYSIYRQPRLLMRGENKNISTYEASAKAYLDMAVRDEEFDKFVLEVRKLSLQKTFKEFFKPLEGGIKPIEYFSKFLNDVIDVNHMHNASKRKSANILIKHLSEL